MEWADICGCFLAPQAKIRFPTIMGFPNTNLTAILFPSQGINYLNQPLEEINDWAQNKKWVVDSFMGSPIDTWINTIGSRV